MQTRVSREFIFTEDRPFASCHASTLLPLPGERVLAAWFGGPYESHGDVAIWLSVRAGNGTWSVPRKVADEEGLPHWNPVLATAPDGTVHLFYKVGPNCREWRTRFITSADGGESWSKPIEPPVAGGYPVGPVKNKPIVLKDGTWLAPTSLETETTWDAAVTISRDNGRVWELGGPVPVDHGEFSGNGIIQPTLWESAPGALHMLLRSTAGRIYRSDSIDGGRTWCLAYATELPNNNSGIDLAQSADGTLALCHNPVPADWGKRTPLIVAFSNDNGSTWTDELILEDDDPPIDEQSVKLDRAHRANEFSYPAIVAHGSKLLVTYTWKRERICYREIDGGWNELLRMPVPAAARSPATRRMSGESDGVRRQMTLPLDFLHRVIYPGKRRRVEPAAAEEEPGENL
jgi:predicted neuraminidase